jgi:hypothetical protein
VGILDEHCKNNYEVVCSYLQQTNQQVMDKIKILIHSEYAVAKTKLLQPTNLKMKPIRAEL